MTVINWGAPSTIKWGETIVKNETVTDVTNMLNHNIDVTKELFEAVISEMDRRTVLTEGCFNTAGSMFKKVIRKNRGTRLGLILAVAAGVAYVIYNESEKKELKIKALELHDRIDELTGAKVSGFEAEGNAIPPRRSETAE